MEKYTIRLRHAVSMCLTWRCPSGLRGPCKYRKEAVCREEVEGWHFNVISFFLGERVDTPLLFSTEMAHVQIISHVTTCKINDQFSVFLLLGLSAVFVELITCSSLKLCFIILFYSVLAWLCSNLLAVPWCLILDLFFPQRPKYYDISVLCYPLFFFFHFLLHCLSRWFYTFPWFKIL